MVTALSTLLEMQMNQYNWYGIERGGKEVSGYIRFGGAELLLIKLAVKVAMVKGVHQNN